MTFLSWWQHLPLILRPEIFSVGPFTLYWYAVFFLAGASVVFLFVRQSVLRRSIFTAEDFADFSFWLFFSVLVGGKTGFLFFYWWPFTSSALPVHGTGLPGMSFFGGLILGSGYVYWYCKKHEKNFWDMADALALFVPLGIFFGRLGNFFHNELWGRVTEVPWGMYFENETVLRHPSTLYAAFLEGVVLFIFLLLLRKQKEPGEVSAYFLIGYAVLRFISEYFREADKQIGYFGTLTLNQAFCFIIGVLGILLLTLTKKRAIMYS
jgi:phosphatidylglycerol---prolipoprotein diacylglyceryl transferase